MDPRLAEIIRFLNDNKIRATYGAVAGVLGVVPRSMGARLGSQNRAASWIVSAKTGRPTGYSNADIHPDVLTSTQLIRTGPDLTQRMLEKARKGD